VTAAELAIAGVGLLLLLLLVVIGEAAAAAGAGTEAMANNGFVVGATTNAGDKSGDARKGIDPLPPPPPRPDAGNAAAPAGAAAVGRENRAAKKGLLRGAAANCAWDKSR
jgi:hypothetical protein